ncbi:MAG: hypothetical protein ACK4TO_03865 [Candidatus Nitrosotenuis sp.]
MIPRYVLSEDGNLEYYRNRCNVLEQLVNRLSEENKLLKEENRQLKQELAVIKETVSSLVAKNINAKPDKKPYNSTAKKLCRPSTHQKKSRPNRTIQTVP